MEQRHIFLVSTLAFFLLLSIVSPVLSASYADRGSNGVVEWNKLMADRQKAKTVPELSTENSRYVLPENRNFSLFIVSNSPSPTCRACQMLNEPLMRIIRLLQKDTAGDIPLFIYQLDVSKNYLQHLLTKLSISRVPSIYYYNPQKSGFPIAERNIMPMSYETINFAYISNWMNNVAGTNYIELPIPFWMRIFLRLDTNTIILLLGVPALAVIALAIRKPFHPGLWFILTLGVYFCNQAGVVWNFIRNPQFVGLDGNSGEIRLIDQGNNQFVIEGIIAGTVNSGIALSVLGMVVVSPMIKNYWVRGASFVVSCLASLFFFYCLMNIYLIKHPYYPFYFRIF